MPKISIITPVWVDSDIKVSWLDEMIRSMQAQTLADWELILIDDKSPISLDYLRDKYRGDNRLRWLENNANEGPAKTRNLAVACAITDCILPLDADDLLADNEVLEVMYDTWLMDKTKIIYGNLQFYQPGENGQFRLGKVIQLAQYTFQNTLDLRGMMPVTCMHSVNAHEKAGGWKAILDQGREDVEYWIACGEAGFCGQKINHTTLLYRRHQESRDYKLRNMHSVRAMQDLIKEMHKETYRGNLPMACCGKSATNTPVVDPVVMSQQAQAKSGKVKYITELEGYAEDQLEWVFFESQKQASIGRILVSGPANLPNQYKILGNGHAFQIHKRHHHFFSDRQRLGFQMNFPDPRAKEPEPEPEIQIQETPRVIEVPKPELATLVRPDQIMLKTKQLDVKQQTVANRNLEDYIPRKDRGETLIEPNPPQSVSSYVKPQMPTDYFKAQSQHVSNLDLSPSLTDILDEAGYTIESLAGAKPDDLTHLPNIGLKRAQTIIEKAKELLKG